MIQIKLTIFASIFLCFVLCKNGVRSLTKSMGHEIIEIGPSIKELPPGLEEEPSGENNEDEAQSTITTMASTTKKEIQEITTTASSSPNTVKKNGLEQEDEEAKIEKELADMYKDNSDYKSDSNEITTDALTSEAQEKAVARQRPASFKFQPDLHNRADVDRFRTSVDDISCDKHATVKLTAEKPLSQSASKHSTDFILGMTSLILTYKLY